MFIHFHYYLGSIHRLHSLIQVIAQISILMHLVMYQFLWLHMTSITICIYHRIVIFDTFGWYQQSFQFFLVDWVIDNLYYHIDVHRMKIIDLVFSLLLWWSWTQSYCSKVSYSSSRTICILLYLFGSKVFSIHLL